LEIGVEKFKDQYRIPSSRLAEYDYGSNAAYFVTICTRNRTHDFGSIVDGSMQLSTLGQAAANCWAEIPNHFGFVLLDGFVVMPNHVHGILVFDKPMETKNIQTETQNIQTETQNVASLQGSKNRFGPQSQNLGSVVRGYKIGVTQFARKNGNPFVWQERYHEHVIRDEHEYQRVFTYIQENPRKWAEDVLFSEFQR
jgi:putative transposase